MTFYIRYRARSLTKGYTLFFYALLTLFTVSLMLVEAWMPTLRYFLPQVYGGTASVIKIGLYAAASFIFVFTVTAFKSGTDRFFLRKAQNKGAMPKDFFYYFHPKRAALLFCFYINFYLRKAGLILLCFLPSVLSGVVSAFLLRGGEPSFWAVLTSAVTGIALTVNGIVFYLKLSGFLFISRYFFVCGTYVSMQHLFSCAIEEGENVRRELFKMRLSFTGWFLSCVFVLPIGFVWGYYRQAMAAVVATRL